MQRKAENCRTHTSASRCAKFPRLNDWRDGFGALRPTSCPRRDQLCETLATPVVTFHPDLCVPQLKRGRPTPRIGGSALTSKMQIPFDGAFQNTASLKKRVYSRKVTGTLTLGMKLGMQQSKTCSARPAAIAQHRRMAANREYAISNQK